MRSPLVPGTSVSARRGVRRSPKQITAHLRRALPRRDALDALRDPQIRAKAVAECSVILWDGADTRIAPVATLTRTNVESVMPVRRLGSHMHSRSNLMIHTARFAGLPAVVWAESKLEQLWMMELDRRADVHRYQSQACVLSWPVGERCILQIPDLLVSCDSGVEIVSVRAEDDMGTYARVILTELLPETFRAHGIDYRVCGTMPRQRTVNLRLLGALRWKAPAMKEPWWVAGSDIQSTKSLGAVSDAFGGGPVGRGRALRALAQCHLDVDLDRPITQASEVAWR